MLLPILYIHACALIHASAATYLWLAATPLYLPGAGTVYYSDILSQLLLAR
jgi:hypothetical protein